MNKKELINVIAERTHADRGVIASTLDMLEAIVVEELKKGGQVNLTGFGIFHTAVRKGRAGVNPRKPEERIQIPPVRVAKFRPGKTLKESVK
ncbi:MAG: HU family DNA-binding protein [Candidatus Andersenbacteria bacterium]